ncbi:MAG: hypothetical protein DI536_29000 [Archangium gephyra]|uniref:Uncharacterized protein n=1 Tax=Archangium gephyra TaxID=48 RepID=A0A2W5SZA7_9BACT|nr:MAG: hypothetical protein DI536_29000 [Archangium gephyra]
MSLFDRLLASELAPSPSSAKPSPENPLGLRHPALTPMPEALRAPTNTFRGSCKVINADTGRQCALPAGHALPHRHGSTSFTREAPAGATNFTRRDALDRAAAASLRSNLTPE